jgi:hypothetical protein
MPAKATVIFVVALSLGSAGAHAQERAGAGRVEVGVFPGGGIVFTDNNSAAGPGFGNYALGGSVTFNVNEFVGVEGEFGRSIGRRQDLIINRSTLLDYRTPNMWMYGANLIVSPLGTNRPLAPYLTAGIGGLTATPKGSDFASLSTADTTYVVDNMGGGLKWYSTAHVGLQGDYRFFTLKNNVAAPGFFGSSEWRYGHRIYGGLLLTY